MGVAVGGGLMESMAIENEPYGFIFPFYTFELCTRAEGSYLLYSLKLCFYLFLGPSLLSLTPPPLFSSLTGLPTGFPDLLSCIERTAPKMEHNQLEEH